MVWSTAHLLLVLAMLAAALDQPDPQQQEAKNAVAAANNAFSLDFYQVLRSKTGNLIMSSFSAMAALAMVLQGADGQTAEQLQTALHLPADRTAVRKGFKAFLDGLRTNDQVIVRIANKIFVQRGSHIKAPFRSTVVDSFRADAEELDFARKPEESRVTINRWVEQITDNKIQNLLTGLDPNTLMVLVNAIYFKGNWAKPFEEADTRNETFHTSTSTQVTVPMMHRTAHFGLKALPDLGARVLELPYQGYSMKMLVILPDTVDGLPRVEEGLSRLNLSKISKEMTHGEVEVTLPKFKIESKFDLEEDLPKLGIEDLFGPGADLSGMTNASVMVSKVVQKAFVEVTEKGTTAAAATGVEIVGTSFFVKPQPTVFKIDRPFLFILSSEDAVCFMGRVKNPEK